MIALKIDPKRKAIYPIQLDPTQVEEELKRILGGPIKSVHRFKGSCDKIFVCPAAKQASDICTFRLGSWSWGWKTFYGDAVLIGCEIKTGEYKDASHRFWSLRNLVNFQTDFSS